MKIRRLIRRLLAKIPGHIALPLIFYRYHQYFIKPGNLDSEIQAVRKAKRHSRRAIDIGANIGIYTYAFSRLFDQVEAFEPLERCTTMLKDYAKRHGGITIRHVGLSNESRKTELFVPLNDDLTEDSGLASVNDRHAKRVVIPITVAKLDDFNFTPVDLIKIDVEGHEWEVLEGAIETIRRERPVLLIEIEQRHLAQHDIRDVFRTILSMGYEGAFLDAGDLVPIDQFSYDTHQRPYLENIYSKRYINNFIFQPLHDADGA